jgi:endonuclease/exonuclease/phosphatase (EEP) superfamily protein YafD
MSAIKGEATGALTFAALLVAGALAGGYSTFDHPALVILANIRPYCAIGLLVLGGLLLALGGRLRAALFGLAAVAVFADLGATLLRQRGAWSEAHERAGQRVLTVVSFNVYNNNPLNTDRVASILAAASADLMVLLEATKLRDNLPVLRGRFPFAAGCVELSDTCDLIILSRHPVADVAIRSLGPISPTRFVSAKVTVGMEPITVVAAHLTKPYFDFHGWREIRNLARLVKTLPGPLLLAGDFNATPWSETLTLLQERTGLVGGPLPVPTWPASVGDLGLPIDHILTRPPVAIQRILPFADNLGSNHRGLAAQIRY